MEETDLIKQLEQFYLDKEQDITSVDIKALKHMGNVVRNAYKLGYARAIGVIDKIQDKSTHEGRYTNMDNRDITKAILQDEGLTQVQFCEMIGLKSQGYLASMMHRSYSADAMYRLLAPLGYEMVIRKKDKENAPEYVLEVRTPKEEENDILAGNSEETENNEA